MQLGRIAFTALSLFGVFAAAAPLRAQSCWPVGVLLAVRDADGRRIDPSRLDSVVTTERGESRPAARRVRSAFQPATGTDSLNLLQWARSGCHLELKSATLYLGGRAMRLNFALVVDSEQRRRASVFLFEAPPFREGTFTLRCGPDENAGSPDPVLLRDRWSPAADP